MTFPNSSPPLESAHIPPSDPPEGKGPLRIGAHHIPSPCEKVHTWSDLCDIISSGDLADLNRHDRCESSYIAWREPIRSHYGSLETYIRIERLHWEEPTSSLTGYFQHDSESRGEAKCIPNDWPYGVPYGVGHYVIWSKLPILHEDLFLDQDTPFDPEIKMKIYDAVVQDGVRGFTGTHRSVVGLDTVALLKEKETTTGGINAVQLAQSAHTWAGREITKYVQEKWPIDQWETAWFANPPHLRTVPGLSHLHVMVRRKSSLNSVS